MSGITSLIDTLMHQVLGKRVDTQPPREINQPVKPTTPSEAARAIRSDSRLDARTGANATQPGQRSSEHARAGSSLGNPITPGAPSSSQTHFSPAARSIANLLALYPAPRSSLALPTALLGDGEPPDAANIASRLTASLRDSGLFYESHLRQWHNGTAPRHQLEREPQMLHFQQHGKAPATVLAGHSQEPVGDALQGIVRHQLEMLASPVIRWEGDAWSGILLALLIHPPGDAGKQQSDEEEPTTEDSPWHTEINLDLRAGGHLKAAVLLKGDSLKIDLRATSPSTLRSLEENTANLHARLNEHGFGSIEVSFAQLHKDDPDDQ